MKSGLIIVLSLFVLCCVVSKVSAHNHLIWPTPRDPRQTYAGDNNCESGNGNFPGGQTFQRGQRITPKWSYNNHRGGFVRFSIVKQGQENQNGVFNRAENIVAYGCHTKTCGGAGQPFDGGDKFPCNINFNIPSHLDDGNYILQWIVYSMFDSDANPNKGLPNYLSCANIKIQGGQKTNEQPGKCSFIWVGGDKEYSRTAVPKGAADTCVYFMKNTIGKAWDTVKINPSFVKGGGRPAEVEACLKNGGVGQKGGASTNNNDNNNNNNNNDNSSGECQNWYKSEHGENCASIAQKNGITEDRFKELNSFINCNDVWPGTNACVDKPKNSNNNNSGECQNWYKSHQGENCGSIAGKHGISEDRFKQLNSFVNCHDIWAGTNVCVDK